MARQASFAELRRLIDNAGFRPQTIRVSFGDDAGNIRPRAEIKLTKGVHVQELESDEPAFWRYCLTLKGSVDRNGAPTMSAVRDLNRYWSELEALVRDIDHQRKLALAQVTTPGFKLAYHPKQLIRRFLESRNWGSPEYLPLKQDFRVIEAILVLEGRDAVVAQQRLYAKNPTARKYGDRVEELLSAAFLRSGNPIQDFLSLIDGVRFDLDGWMGRLSHQLSHTDDMMRMLAERGTLPGHVGIKYLLDLYRRWAEWTTPVVTVLSEAVQRVDGGPRLDPTTGLEKRLQHIRASRWADIVDVLDADIRHSESHGATIVEESGKVKLTDSNGSVLKEYRFDQVSDMTLALQRGLVPGFFAAFAIAETALLLLVASSREYVDLVLGIDNRAD